ncbi:MAG: hypothetical protein HOK97_13130 [Deltaproteobacteria bacterium]|jgi:hypothetical protein|nr:hypothetical protein [Deltaproteobacteria bacterium]MBT6490705.1 hypothetical protein [Deltaproteobacteria bacterium]
MVDGNNTSKSKAKQERRRIALVGLPGAGHELVGWSLKHFFDSTTEESTSLAADFSVRTLSPERYKQELEQMPADVIVYISRNCLTEAEKLYPSWYRLGSVLDAPIAIKPATDEPLLSELKCFLGAWRDCAQLADKGTIKVGTRTTSLIPVRFEDLLFSRDVFLALFRAIDPGIYRGLSGSQLKC